MSSRRDVDLKHVVEYEVDDFVVGYPWPVHAVLPQDRTFVLPRWRCGMLA